MSWKWLSIGLLWLAGVLPALAQNVPAMVFHFVEQEPGIDPYPVRMIVTRDYLRIDDGVDGGDFLLFERGARRISTVNREDRTVLTLHPAPQTPDPAGRPTLGEAREDSSDMPSFQGRRPVYMRYLAGGKTCRQVVAVPGVYPEWVAAMREYLTVLADQQVLTLDHTPPEERSDCMLANVIYAPARHLAAGFPLREWDDRGRLRQLTGVTRQEVDSALFELPQGLRRLRLTAHGVEPVAPPADGQSAPAPAPPRPRK